MKVPVDKRYLSFIVGRIRIREVPFAGFPDYYYKCDFCELCETFKKPSIFLLIVLRSR